MIVHAGCVARRCGRRWAGLLIVGPSGSGKSDLALRLLGRGWRLVSDDRTVVWASSGQVFGAAAPALAGLVEARGLGILAAPALPLAPIHMVARCLPRGAAPERLPEPGVETLAGLVVPAFEVNALEESAALKLELALGRQGLCI